MWVVMIGTALDHTLTFTFKWVNLYIHLELFVNAGNVDDVIVASVNLNFEYLWEWFVETQLCNLI